MEWFIKLMQNPESLAHLVILYALVISLGVRLGRWRIGGKNGIAFGVTWVLFVGILVGHICTHYLYADPVAAVAGQKHVIDMVKELGLILFVYCIGLQVGPSFFQTFKSGGLGMNMLTLSLVLLNVAVMIGLYFLATALGIFGDPHSPNNLPMMVGVLYGAVTNTPGLGAANNVLPDLMTGVKDVPVIANGYACAYPLGVVGIILATIAVRFLTRTSLEEERKALEAAEENDPASAPKHLVIRVTKSAAEGRTLEALHQFLNVQFVISRCILPDGTLLIPGRETVLEQNMQIHLVCAEKDAERISELLGELIEVGHEEKIESEQYVSRRLVVTRPEINGKSFAQLHVSTLYNVNVTRVTRHGMDLFAARDLRLQVGDRILVTGTEKNIERFKDVVGAQVKHLDHPNVGAIFFGILIGIIVGQIPIPIPGITVPVKLGLAGGPLVVAILIGAVGYRYKINTYVSTSANLLLREVGLVLFLSSVGIQAGASFWNTIAQGDGVHYVWMGFLITTVPILLVGVFARLKMKLNYFTLMGLIAGSNTDPPALAFANATAGNNAPAVGYSTVYPLAMFMRILLAQLVLSVFLG